MRDGEHRALSGRTGIAKQQLQAEIEVPLKMSSSFPGFISPLGLVLQRDKQAKLLSRAICGRSCEHHFHESERQPQFWFASYLLSALINDTLRACNTMYRAREIKGQESITPQACERNIPLLPEIPEGPKAAFWGTLCQNTFALANHFNHKQISNRK